MSTDVTWNGSGEYSTSPSGSRYSCLPLRLWHLSQRLTYSCIFCCILGHQYLRDINSKVLLLPGWATKMGSWISAITSCIRDCVTISLGCLPFNLLYINSSVSQNYSPFSVRRFCICFLRNKSFLFYLIMSSFPINWFFPTSPTCLLSASTCLILLSGTCSISKSNSDKRKLQRIRGDCCYRRICVEI